MSTSDRVRNELATILEQSKYDWGVRHRDTEDDIGPLTIKYAAETAGIYIEKTMLGACPLELGAPTLFKVFNDVRNQLARQAWELWKSRIERYLFARPVTWKELLNHVGSHNRAPLLFALGLLRYGTVGYGPVRTFVSSPPALSQQKDAVSLPRIDKPGYPDRVYRITAERQP